MGGWNPPLAGSSNEIPPPSSTRNRKEPLLRSIGASDYIAKMDEAREARLGALNPRTIVDAPSDTDIYPFGKKNCACCGRESLRRMPLDGTNYYCPFPACKLARAKWFDNTRRIVALA